MRGWATMSPDAWSLLDGRAERARRSWTETKSALPVGERVRARVLATIRFGVFVEIDGQPDALGLVEIATLPRGGELPAIGVYLDLVVVNHADHNRQVRLRPATEAVE
ncbi:hypothetical protein Strop_4126 [Salinispora tropica CNB-440]|uniref:S1 motif domain-containing protein n=2 Tax=Salinispora tropica TaxID=168695 RepID=A4XC99_SALTO|nr:hypothetical protein Strop_4126 [Salinispora tropica CNB-440]